MLWREAQEWEKKWHDNCVNSYQEESKQIEYVVRMGLVVIGTEGRYPVIDFHNKSVLDVGGGPYSILLKGINLKGTVVDPCDFPQWTKDRYKAAGIEFISKRGEDYCEGRYDIGLIYNCLQHTENPKKIIENMRKMCSLIYIHEWLDTPVSPGHIQTLKEKDLNEWLEGKGIIGNEKWGDKDQPYYCGIFVGI